MLSNLIGTTCYDREYTDENAEKGSRVFPDATKFLRDLYYLRFHQWPNYGVRNRGVRWDEHLHWKPPPDKYGAEILGYMGKTGIFEDLY